MASTRSSSTPPASAGTGVQPTLPIAAASVAAPPPPVIKPEIEIRPSTRRRKTATAFYEADRIVVLVPARLRAADREDVAERLVERLLSRGSRSVASDTELARRAADLADKHLAGIRPNSIRWASNQHRRWGSCTPATRDIRISTRLQLVPTWVLDSVILHELAHLVDASHGPRFRSIVGRFPQLKEADAYLSGYSLGVTSAGWASVGDSGGDEAAAWCSGGVADGSGERPVALGPDPG